VETVAMNRRHFLARSLSPLIPTAEEEITDFGEDGFFVQCGDLHCGVGKIDGIWILSFAVFRTTKAWFYEEEVRLMPSPQLKQRLAELGIATEYDGPCLVAKSEVLVDAAELLRKMKMAESRTLLQN
jgi:hypothetical protein